MVKGMARSGPERFGALRNHGPGRHGTGILPLWLKIAFSIFVLAWTPLVLSTQGWQNFFWLCDMANFLVLAGLWLESRLLLSSQLLATLLVGIAWTVDLLAALTAGIHPFAATAYMFVRPGAAAGAAPVFPVPYRGAAAADRCREASRSRPPGVAATDPDLLGGPAAGGLADRAGPEHQSHPGAVRNTTGLAAGVALHSGVHGRVSAGPVPARRSRHSALTAFRLAPPGAGSSPAGATGKPDPAV